MSESQKSHDEVALWRFGIISPLLHRHEHSPLLKQEYASLSQRPWFSPDGEKKYYSSETFRHWVYLYKNIGIDGLRNKQRKDNGNTSVPEEIQTALKQLRKDFPDVTFQRLMKKLRKENLWDGRKPSLSTMYRFAVSHNLKRGKSKSVIDSVRSFEYPHFGDLWSGDFLHGPKVKQGVYAKKSYLHAIVDDSARYIVAARFYLAENTENMLNDLMMGIRRFGIPRRFYTDNGSAYKSKHLRFVAAKLGIALPHTPPGVPRGRGKIERFFRTVRDQFLTGRNRSSLTKINTDFGEWINEYHHTIHQGIGMSPLNRKLTEQKNELVQLDPTQNINDIFRMEIEKKIGNDGCIRMWKKRFEVRDALPGEKIMVYYLPWDQSYVLTGVDKLIAKQVDTNKNATRFDNPQRGKKGSSS